MSKQQNVLTLKVKPRANGYEGTVTFPGLEGKLRRTDGTTLWAKSSGVITAGRTLAEKFGVTLNLEEDKKTSTTSTSKSKKSTVATAT